ncbi:hypothetical protein [Porphyromonas circumdentaria]|uniref:Uncharacterized protein n=1 Tax=Porphyromonas circumdentaria TaxID=29524 RepID=A0A1T4Q9H4_9PORP|nr:hypothetical protein [Porphyromonas circumdentaria]MBB6275223.1 hypothetical protein [Porphyromonas circumdentaria]SKA00354.1 hypothetical protein SAMN02745171_01740 [Porphyromonas circumdentaria]
MEIYKIDRISRWWWIVLGILIVILVLICIFDDSKGVSAGIFLIVLYCIPLGGRLLIQKILEKRARVYIYKKLAQIQQTKTIEELEQIHGELGKKRRYSVRRFVYDHGIRPRMEMLATLFCKKNEKEIEEKLEAATQILQLQEVVYLMADIDEFIEDTEAVATYKKSVQRLFTDKLFLLLSSSTSAEDFHQAFELCLLLEKDFANELYQGLRAKLSQATFLSYPLKEPVAKDRLCYYKAPITLIIPKKNSEDLLEEYELYVFDNTIEILSDDSRNNFLIRNILRKRVSEGVLHLLINNNKVLFKGFPQIFILDRLIDQIQDYNA